MKKITLTLVGIMLYAGDAFSQTLNHDALCKKWCLEKYEVMWVDYEPEEIEEKDYILLNKDMTYQAVSEGDYSEGQWSFNKDDKYFVLYNADKEELKFLVESLKSDHMVVAIDVKELKGIDIHYINKQK